MPQGSIIGPILFNIFINDIFLFIKSGSMHNFADDNTLSAFAQNMDDLVQLLQINSIIAVNWLTDNGMIANPSKFHALIMAKNKNIVTAEVPITIHDKVIKSEKSVTLLGIKIDNNLSFDIHIGTLCNRAGGQLNALYRLSSYINLDSRRTLIYGFIYSNFNYCPLVWHFTSSKSINKIENIQKRALRFLHNE